MIEWMTLMAMGYVAFKLLPHGWVPEAYPWLETAAMLRSRRFVGLAAHRGA